MPSCSGVLSRALACRRKRGAAEGSSHRSFGFPSIYFAEVLWHPRKFLKLINAKVSYTVVPHTQEKKKKPVRARLSDEIV